MHLSHIKLVNFRGFKELDLDLHPGVTVLMGGNAQGKTTILEAIYLLAIARSFRAENERELVNWQAGESLEQTFVDATMFGADGRYRVIVGYRPIQGHRASPSANTRNARTHSVRKEVRVGGVRRTASDLVGLFNVVLFSAEDIELVQGSPSLRRRYLDILISQADPTYLKTLQRYQKVLQQRNQLLKLLSERRANEDELDFWDGELVREGAWITNQRTLAIASVAALARSQHLELTHGREELAVDYRPSVAADGGPASAEAAYRTLLLASRRRELALGATVVGPHRDDFKLLVDGVDMGLYSSRGQARTLALTLRLSEAAFLAGARGAPVVLLDDVLSELDPNRRRQVLQRALSYEQTLITATDLDAFPTDFLANARILKVDQGAVSSLVQPVQAPHPGA